MPEQIFDIPLTNGTSVSDQDIVYSWDLWSFFSEEDTTNPTPITATVVLLGAVFVASFALLNVLLIVLFVKSLAKKGLHSLPQDHVRKPNTNPAGCTEEKNNYAHLTMNA